MVSLEALWSIQQARQRERLERARERLARDTRRSATASAGLVGWIRGRIRVFRRPTPGQVGWAGR